LYAGAIVVPAYPPRFNLSLRTLDAIAVDARARHVVTTAELRERIEARTDEWRAFRGVDWLTSSDASDDSRAFEPLEREPGALAILQYTSGSTQTPRGVELTVDNLACNVALLVGHLGATSSDRVVTWLPPYHDMGLVGAILCPLTIGAQAILMSPSTFLRSPLRWLKAVSEYRGTISGAPDFAYRYCVRRTTEKQRNALDLSAWRVAFSGAERVRADTIEMFCEAFAPAGFSARAFAPCYGLAEATLGVSFAAIGQAPKVLEYDDAELGKGRGVLTREQAAGRRLVSCGRPLPGVDVRSVDPETTLEVPDGSIGEIWVRGRSIARGYWNREESTKQVFHARLRGLAEDFLSTGDLGFLLEGELYVTGRSKDLIVILGVNHYPEDIEPTVEGAHPLLREGGSVAFSLPVDGEEVLVVVAEVRRPTGFETEDVARVIRQAVAEAHQLPVHEVVLIRPGTLPKTSSGKRRRRRCRQQHLGGELRIVSRDRSLASTDLPGSPGLVQELAALMAETLGLDTVGATDDFFALGGHSLLATRLASRLEAKYGMQTALSSVFEAPTAAALAVHVARHVAEGSPEHMRQVDRTGPLVLSYSQERMWFQQELERLGTAYNVAGALEIGGAFVAEHLRAALQALLARHSILRSNYDSIDGVPTLRIRERVEIELPVVDVSTAPDPLERAKELGSELASKPFALDRDALMRVKLFRSIVCIRSTYYHFLFRCIYSILLKYIGDRIGLTM
jgi:acyl-CoA synthetase (AMP-forming)/AMP-acid ligase II